MIMEMYDILVLIWSITIELYHATTKVHREDARVVWFGALASWLIVVCSV